MRKHLVPWLFAAWLVAMAPGQQTRTGAPKKSGQAPVAAAQAASGRAAKAPAKGTPQAPANSSAKGAPKGAGLGAAARASTAQGRASYARSSVQKRPPSRSAIQSEPTPERYREIQRALASRGYLKEEPNGIWGPVSIDALRRFQQDQNLEPTGKLDSLSIIALGLGPKRTVRDAPVPENETRQP